MDLTSATTAELESELVSRRVRVENPRKRMIAAIGAVLRERRKSKVPQLTLKHLSKQTGLSLGYLSQIELGKNMASLDTLQKIAVALGLRLSDVVRQVEDS